MKLDRFIKRPVLSTVVSVFVVLIGLISLSMLPVERYPDIAPPTISVFTQYPGANAQTVVNSVLAPLEEAINGVEGMTHITGSANNGGGASVTVYFAPGSDPDMAQVNVQNRVTQVSGLLPQEVIQGGISVRKRQSSTLLMFSLISIDDRYDATFLQNYADINIIPRVQRVYGVGGADVQGAKTYTMRIWLKPEVMSRYGITPQDIRLALQEQNLEAAPGNLGEQSDVDFQYTLTTAGRLNTPEQFGNIILRADKNGDILRLKEVADVEYGALNYNVDGKTDGHNSVAIEVSQASGSNATEVINNVLDIIEEVKKDLPAGLEIKVGMNANEFLQASMNNVYKTLIEAFILVMIVVFLFLQDFRSTLIPAIAIPVSLIGSFIILLLLGFSLNLLVLGALVLAIAIVVDDAIVVVEAVHAKLETGYQSPVKASIDAMGEISGVIVSITLVMMAVFVPVAFIGGTAGTFYSQFGLTMAAAIFFSAINALTLSPALCALFLKSKDEKTGKNRSFGEKFRIGFNEGYSKLLGGYRRSIEKISTKRWLTAVAVAATAGLLVFLMNKTSTGFIPSEDTGTIMVQVGLQPGTSQHETKKVINQVQDIILEEEKVESVIMMQGFGLMGGGLSSNYGSLFLQLKDWSERKSSQHSADAISARLRQKLGSINNAQVMIATMPTIPGFGITDGFTFSLQNKGTADIQEFFRTAQAFITELNAQDEILFARTSFSPDYPMYEVKLDAAKLKLAGISPQTIYSTLQGYLGGMYVSDFNAFGKLYRVYLRSTPESRATPSDLSKIYVRNGEQMAPISQFVSLEKVYGPMSVSRFNLFTSIDVMGAPASGYSTGDAIAAISRVASSTLPTNIGYEFSGITREEQKSGGNTTALILIVCIVFIYLLLSAQYESYFLPLAVILSIPFGLLGSFVFAQLFGLENNIYVQISLIMLIGLLAKNAILIVEFARQRREAGMSIKWSAVAGAEARLRPIIMTSLALIIGLLPMLFASGAGAKSNLSLGATAIGGMALGTLLQVFFVPGLYIIFQYLQEKVKPIKHEGLDTSEVNTEISQYSDITVK